MLSLEFGQFVEIRGEIYEYLGSIVPPLPGWEFPFGHLFSATQSYLRDGRLLILQEQEYAALYADRLLEPLSMEESDGQSPTV